MSTLANACTDAAMTVDVKDANDNGGKWSERIPRELARILSIPERPLVDCNRYLDSCGKWIYPAETQALIEVMTERFAKPKGRCTCKEKGYHCILELNAEQAWGLREIAKYGSVLGYLPIGSGKSALSLLAPLAL